MFTPACARNSPGAGKTCFPCYIGKGASAAGGKGTARRPLKDRPTLMPSSAVITASRPADSPPELEDFASLLDETLGRDSGFDGSVVTGRVVRLTEEFAIVDVGLKSEGRVALKEFGAPGAKPDVKPGDVI